MKRTPIRRVSKKRAREGREYATKRRIFLERNPLCQIKSKVCTKHATVIQHSRGRVGKLFLDERWWIASCWACNDYCDNYEKKWAMENGFRKDRLGNL